VNKNVTAVGMRPVTDRQTEPYGRTTTSV